MLFNSFEFLIFFPIVTTLYYILPFKYRWMLLLLASCIFYMFFIPIYILILLVTISIDYYAALLISKSNPKKKKLYLVISIISTCLVLFIFKYANFFIDNFNSLAKVFHLNYSEKVLNIILPIGLSFHTFQSLSYVIEVYRNNQSPEKHFGIYALYVMFYPQLVAGPIERPQNLLHQFRVKHEFSYNNIVSGLKLILIGFIKKIIIADRLAIYVNTVYNNYDHHNGLSLLLATIFFAFQIYCDFSGYSDIARGCAKVMGFNLMLNFNKPYFSKSVSEFWKRWHISLSTWFKDYVYIPLGGNRVSRLKHTFNLLFTFLISGFWHGANWTYVVWGGLNGFYLVIENQLRKISINHFSNSFFIQAFKLVLTFSLINLSWIFFRATNFHEAIVIIHKIFTDWGSLFIGSKAQIFYSVFGLVLLIIMEAEDEYKLTNIKLFNSKHVAIRYISYLTVIFLIILTGVFNKSQFIYFQF